MTGVAVHVDETGHGTVTWRFYTCRERPVCTSPERRDRGRVNLRARNHVCKGALAGDSARVSPPPRRGSSWSWRQARCRVFTWGPVLLVSSSLQLKVRVRIRTNLGPIPAILTLNPCDHPEGSPKKHRLESGGQVSKIRSQRLADRGRHLERQRWSGACGQKSRGSGPRQAGHV